MKNTEILKKHEEYRTFRNMKNTGVLENMKNTGLLGNMKNTTILKNMKNTIGYQGNQEYSKINYEC